MLVASLAASAINGDCGSQKYFCLIFGLFFFFFFISAQRDFANCFLAPMSCGISLCWNEAEVLTHQKLTPHPADANPMLPTLRLASGCHLSPTNGACGYTGSFLSTTMMKLRSVGAIVAVTPQSSLYRSQFEGRQKGQKELTNVAHK